MDNLITIIKITILMFTKKTDNLCFFRIFSKFQFVTFGIYILFFTFIGFFDISYCCDVNILDNVKELSLINFKESIILLSTEFRSMESVNPTELYLLCNQLYLQNPDLYIQTLRELSIINLEKNSMLAAESLRPLYMVDWETASVVFNSISGLKLSDSVSIFDTPLDKSTLYAIIRWRGFIIYCVKMLLDISS